MIQTASDKIIVTVKSKYCKNFTDLMKRVAIQDGTSVHLEDFVSLVGTVVSIPKTISNNRTYTGFSTKDIQVGDEVIFSFNVIYDHYQKMQEGEFIYKNLITLNAQEFWMADITKIYAVIRDEKITMINGYVMATPFAEDRIITAQRDKKAKGVKSSVVMHIGNPKETHKRITAEQGDTIFYSPNHPIKYQINNKPFIILQQHQVLGKSVK